MAELCDASAMFIVDKEHKIILWSEGAEKLLDLKKAEVLGKRCPQEYDISENPEKQQQDLELKRADGQIIAVKQYPQALFNSQGAFAGGLCLLQPRSVQSSAFLLTDSSPQNLSQNFQGILSRSPQMQPVFQIIQSAAKTEATVLVRGESGTGKELVARAIHDLSSRSKQPFLAINCAALSSNLLESELFGHVRGAFSGAIKDHAGLFSQADGGTLFLDEVAELPLELQAKLLRVIQERVYTPVGDTRSYSVNVRIVAATHRALREEVKAGRFREDLMYRLRVVPIFIPPLRERREDINLLLAHFIEQHNQKGLRQIEKIDPQAMRVLLDYQWKGNIRELQNVLEYAFVVGRGSVLRLSELPPEFRESPEPIKESTEPVVLSATAEKQAIEQALIQCNGKVTHAAKSLDMSRATFWRKRKTYGI
ncbi:MAG: AAA domain-containing protein [Methylococcaceae bacterium]|nr:AAA domain-containing protein [Methylococcaceae bacterium]